MLDRLLAFIAAIAPIGALLCGVATVAVVLSWVVTGISGRKVERPFGPLPRSEMPEPSRAPAIGSGGVAIALFSP